MFLPAAVRGRWCQSNLEVCYSKYGTITCHPTGFHWVARRLSPLYRAREVKRNITTWGTFKISACDNLYCYKKTISQIYGPIFRSRFRDFLNDKIVICVLWPRVKYNCGLRNADWWCCVYIIRTIFAFVQKF